MSASAASRSPANEPALLQHLFSSRPSRHRLGDAATLAAAVLAHALLLYLLWAGGAHLAAGEIDLGVGTGKSTGAAGGGGGGGEDVHYVALDAPAQPSPAPEAAPPVPPPTPVPVPDPPPLPVPQLAAQPLPKLAAAAVLAPVAASTLRGKGDGVGTGNGAGSGNGAGPGSGGGTGGGEGTGNGSGVGSGSGSGKILAPSPEFLLLPPTPAPGSVRGRTIIVRLALDAAGTVRAVELIPETGDRDYDKKLRETARGWRFRPARGPDNQPIAVHYDVSFTF